MEKRTLLGLGDTVEKVERRLYIGNEREEQKMLLPFLECKKGGDEHVTRRDWRAWRTIQVYGIYARTVLDWGTLQLTIFVHDLPIHGWLGNVERRSSEVQKLKTKRG